MTPFEIEMIRTFADCNMSLTQASKQLYIHRNTMVYHFDKIHKRTGLNPRVFDGLVELLSRIERGEVDE